MKKAFITGVAGQDGSYLAELLLGKGYEVHGILRRSSLEYKSRIDHLYKGETKDAKFFPHYGDITDSSVLFRLLDQIRPDEIYNLAAQSHVRVSFDMPEYTADVDGIGTLRILEAMRTLDLRSTRFYQASTSELYGKVQEVPQTETTPFYPRSPYGVAKLYSYWIVKNYRESYGMYACNGILFNHESPRRGNSFVTQKIVEQSKKVLNGEIVSIKLGNLYSKRDWGHAKDYVKAMWLMLQQQNPDDFVISTGVTTTIKEFTEMVFLKRGVKLTWIGEGLNEKGVDKNGKILVEIDPYYFRPTEVDLLIGDSSKARKILGWEPEYDLEGLVDDMIAHS